MQTLKENLTYFFPYYERLNIKFWVRLKNGQYVITERACILETVRAYYGAQSSGMDFKACPCLEQNNTLRVFLLYLFYNKLTDRRSGRQI